jgi:23S rRNA G2445 N2-methylase RlmL
VPPGESQAQLLDRARQPGFTPGRREIAPLLDLLADLGPDQDKDIRATERALARRPELTLPACLARLAGGGAGDNRGADGAGGADSGRGRARLLRLIGRAAAGAAGEVRAAAAEAVAAVLADSDVRVRRQAALALARTGDPAAEDALLGAWRGETDPSVRRALASALGVAGRDRALAALRAALPDATDPELRRLLEKAILTASRTMERSAGSVIDGTAAPAAPTAVVLRCRAGLERLLAAELAAGGWPVEATASARVETRLAGPLSSLFHFRLHHGIAFPLAARAGATTSGVVDALTSPEAAAVFATFTRGPVRFRLEWERGGHRRAEVWRVAGAIAARRPDLVNDPTDSTWRVHVAEDGDQVAIALEPRKLDDPRFAYRVADVPAASHPTVAAALARLSVTHSLAPAGDVVWDPFVGSGLELCERGRLAPFRRLVGSDVSSEALAAARANVESAGVKAELAVGDALTHDVPGATVILTNPPMGHRVLRGRAQPLLIELVDRAAAILPAGGLLCWISPIPGQTRTRAAAAGLRLVDAHAIDMGGFAAEIQVLRRERPKTPKRRRRR